MGKAEGLPPTASVASVGPGINYIGSHCFAYGGKRTVANTTLTFLEFFSGSGYIFAKFFFGYDTSGLNSGNEIGYEIFFNDLSIMDNTSLMLHGWALTGTYPPELIIPPFTKVKVTMETDDASGIALNASMTGRVYDV